jgi:PKD repeat protein
MIPNSTNFPNSLDNDNNLFLVHDSLRVRLLEDYNPGDTSITIEGEDSIISKFPSTGIITLTEQCSEIDKRAISLYYGSRTSSTFNNLELLPEFSDVVKPKKITNVTMNVLDKHHNHLKDSLIEIQKFLGTKNQVDQVAFGSTITSRLNYLRNLVYKPKAWFTVNKKLGIIPLTIEFEEDSYYKNDEISTFIWNFGDGTTLTTTDSKVQHTYNEVGNYSVSLAVINSYGEDIVEFEKLILAKLPAPKEAAININQKSTQNFTDGSPPKIRSSINDFISLEIKTGENPEDSGYSYGGELLGENQLPIDPIIEYTWNLGDDLIHTNSNYTNASYGIGGYYDILLRTDTQFGSYRITKYENSIDIVENQNLWLFNLTNELNSSGTVKSWEFGLISQTFKILGNQELFLDRNNSFLDEYASNEFYEGTEERAKKEFFKNVAFAQQGSLSSGSKGNSLLFWSSGGENKLNQEIKIKKYNGFDDTYLSENSITRPWNWASLISRDNAYFIFGSPIATEINANLTENTKTTYSLSNLSSIVEDLAISDFENGAEELLSNPSFYDSNGIPTNGYFSTYRTTWKDESGYILRNSSVNDFFRISNFYRTNGSSSSPFNTITKMTDMTGTIKTEGELVTLSSGVFFFNNSGEILAWNDTTLTWEIGRSNPSSLSFRSLQDTNSTGFDNKANSLLATSDEDSLAYLSFDYSNNVFIKFNLVDLTFSSLPSRPSGEQLNLGIY